MKKCMALALCLALVFTAFSPAAWLSYADEEPEIIWLEKGYTFVDSFSEGIAETELYLERGFIDKTGKEIVPLKYDRSSSFSEGMAEVQLDGKYGFIDKTGKEIVPPKYDFVSDFIEGMAMVGMGDWGNAKCGFVDKTGKEVIPLKYDLFSTSGRTTSINDPKFSEGLAAVKLDEKWGFVDKNGKEVVPPKYDYASDFSEGMARVSLDGKKGFIDKNGKEIVPPKYDYASDFSEGMAKVGKGIWDNIGFYKDAEKLGFVDKNGKEVVPLKYDEAKDFSEGLALVRVGKQGYGKYGFIDKTGKEVVSPKYDWAFSFSEGLAVVMMRIPNNGYIAKWGLMKHPLKKEAHYSKVNLSVDGTPTEGMEVYNIKNNNYFKLRDVAKLLEQSEKKFSVDWNAEKNLISLSLGKAYQAAGGELAGGDGKDKTAVLSAAKLELDGKELSLNAYSIGGNNYFKIRDLAEAIGAKVDWDQNTKTILLSTK